jgi:hypothetical protein
MTIPNLAGKIFLIGVVVFLLSCRFRTSNPERGVKTGGIYFDYKIKGEEKDGKVTVYLQFKEGGPNGPSLILNDPAKVELDGHAIDRDNAKVTGAYYEIQRSADSFEGKHIIVFTDLDEKKYNEEFQYHPFGLQKEIPAIINRGDIMFDLKGVKNMDAIRVAATDTSFASRDINEIDTVRNGKLILADSKLKSLVDGPIILMLSKETDEPIRNATKGGGRIVIDYGLQREFELRSSASQ